MTDKTLIMKICKEFDIVWKGSPFGVATPCVYQECEFFPPKEGEFRYQYLMGPKAYILDGCVWYTTKPMSTYEAIEKSLSSTDPGFESVYVPELEITVTRKNESYNQ